MRKTLKLIGLSLIVLILLLAVYFFTIRHFDSQVLESKNYLSAVEKPGALCFLLFTS